MKLLTIKEMIETSPIFKRKKQTTVRSLLKTRSVAPVKTKRRIGAAGSEEGLYDYDEVVRVFTEWPVSSRKNMGKPGRSAGAKPKKETDAPIMGKSQPYRDIDLFVLGKECLDNAAYKGGKINCLGCQRYQKKEFNYYETTN